MNKMSIERRAAVLTAICEGNSIAATRRMFGATKVTILRLLADAGTLASQYHDLTVRNLTTERVQVDELWSFVHAKERNIPEHLLGMPGIGDTWVWTAIDADSKLVIGWEVGGQSRGSLLPVRRSGEERNGPAATAGVAWIAGDIAKLR